uniref:Pept_C1 domain-containing protein n=1 Tax=Steinernema glaseri TaxID=37863 RepID=A0A1I7ZCV4_9BILA
MNPDFQSGYCVHLYGHDVPRSHYWVEQISPEMYNQGRCATCYTLLQLCSPIFPNITIPYECEGKAANYCVLIVGYGEETGPKLSRFSWTSRLQNATERISWDSSKSSKDRQFERSS